MFQSVLQTTLLHSTREREELCCFHLRNWEKDPQTATLQNVTIGRRLTSTWSQNEGVVLNFLVGLFLSCQIFQTWICLHFSHLVVSNVWAWGCCRSRVEALCTPPEMYECGQGAWRRVESGGNMFRAFRVASRNWGHTDTTPTCQCRFCPMISYEPCISLNYGYCECFLPSKGD